MSERLTDRMIAKLASPTTGNRIYFDSEVGGLGVRVTAAGARSFVLCYRNAAGRQRRLTIGAVGDWTIGAARAEAKDLKQKIDQGDDPLGKRIANRDAPTVEDLCARFIEEHVSRKRSTTQRHYRSLIQSLVLPRLAALKVAEVAFSDVDALHRRITKDAPYQANRCIAVLSKCFNLAIKWGWRTDNPCRGIERNHEDRRERFLTSEELDRLGKALLQCPDQQGANIIRLLLLTGSRSGEVRSMRWADLDLKAGVWTKPSAHTKQKTPHRVPLSAPALDLLVQIHRDAAKDALYVFPSARAAGEYRAELKKTWSSVCKAAKIKGFRVHDLRHSYASILASSGHSLPVIGRLLGHTQAQTTHRYSHLMDDPLRLATEKAGSIITNGGGGH
jgi:integrase